MAPRHAASSGSGSPRSLLSSAPESAPDAAYDCRLTSPLEFPLPHGTAVFLCKASQKHERFVIARHSLSRHALRRTGGRRGARRPSALARVHTSNVSTEARDHVPQSTTACARVIPGPVSQSTLSERPASARPGQLSSSRSCRTCSSPRVVSSPESAGWRLLLSSTHWPDFCASACTRANVARAQRHNPASESRSRQYISIGPTNSRGLDECSGNAQTKSCPLACEHIADSAVPAR